jgi:hypothetical protein
MVVFFHFWQVTWSLIIILWKCSIILMCITISTQVGLIFMTIQYLMLKICKLTDCVTMSCVFINDYESFNINMRLLNRWPIISTVYERLCITFFCQGIKVIIYNFQKVWTLWKSIKSIGQFYFLFFPLLRHQTSLEKIREPIY